MADYSLTPTDIIIRNSDGASIPNDPDNRDRIKYNKWLTDGGTPDPAGPGPTPPTLDDIYDQFIQNQKVLKALVLALNDGSLPVGTNKTGAQLKAIIKARM